MEQVPISAALENLVHGLANALLLPGWMIFDYGIVKAAGKKPSVKLGLCICALVVAGAPSALDSL